MFGDAVLSGGPIESLAHESWISPHHGRLKQPVRTSERRRQQVNEKGVWGGGQPQQQRFDDNVDDTDSGLINVDRSPVSNSSSGHRVTCSMSISCLVTSGSVVDITASKARQETFETSPGSLRRAAVKVDRAERPHHRQFTVPTTTQLEQKVNHYERDRRSKHACRIMLRLHYIGLHAYRLCVR